MKYTIEVEIPDERWFNADQHQKNALFESIFDPSLPSEEGDRTTITLPTLAGAPYGFYRDGLTGRNLWYVDSFGAYFDGDSYPMAPMFQPNHGPFTYVGPTRPADV